MVAPFPRVLALHLVGLLVGGGVLAALPPLGAATLRVPTSYPTIQDAIVAATAGDVVLVEPGVYTGAIDFLGKAIRVTSTDGPTATVIQHEQGPIVVFQSGEGPDSVLEGFTVRPPQPPGIMAGGIGMGILCSQSSPTIRHNIVTGNYGLGDGGGIALVASFARVEDNEIFSNTSVCMTQIGPCGAGGGLHIVGGAPLIVGNRIGSNNAPALGGGVYIGGGAQALLRDNRITANSAGVGAGIAVDVQGSVILENNWVAQNTAGGFTLITGIFDGRGGGLYAFSGSDVTVRGCTFTENNTVMPSGPGLGEGGGLWVEDGASLALENSIVWGNFAVSGIDLGHGPAALLMVRYSDVGGAPVPGPGNFDADPLFVAGTFLSQVASGKSAQSPAVDAGDPASPANLGTTRTDGAADQGVLDLGYHARSGVGRFIRGDCNADSATNIADAVTLLGYLFPGAIPTTVTCLDACDASDDGQLNIGDAVTLLGAIFGSPAPPLAPPTSCGLDTSIPNLGCAQFGVCP
ncbi:MAG: right-handed parallel beta-helix repeat-containing protein [Planctomycetota bacterium]